MQVFTRMAINTHGFKIRLLVAKMYSLVLHSGPCVQELRRQLAQGLNISKRGSSGLACVSDASGSNASNW